MNYLNAIDTERTLLQARRIEVQLQGIQAVSTVNLIRSLGGGWGDMQIPAQGATDTGTEVTRK